MAHAWVEVNLRRRTGWLLTPPPPRDKKLVNPKPQPKPKPRPQVLQAPPPPQEQADLTPDVSDDRDTKKKHGFDWAHYLLLVGQGLGVAALVSSPFALILALKAVRGRRRRNRDELGSALGAWAELEDWMRDYGIKLPANATRTQMARYLDIALADYDAAAPRWRRLNAPSNRLNVTPRHWVGRLIWRLNCVAPRPLRPLTPLVATASLTTAPTAWQVALSLQAVKPLAAQVVLQWRRPVRARKGTPKAPSSPH